MNPDPRVERTRAAVLEATADLLLEVGCERMTIDQLACRSGVARSTIYRNWSDRSALVIEAVDRVAAMPEPPDSGTLEGDLSVMADRLATNLTEGPLGRLLPSLVGAASADPELARRLHGLSDARFETTRKVFERAVVRGEIGPADLDGRIERFLAPFFTRRLLYSWELDDAFRRAQVEAALAGSISV